ncbi:hypothetical protein PVAP13_5NG589486 [Panicum virgatum]|uniref:Uncharacterized protein n=1 Tax=Panicum virgatum TaxID=38727 RepID=A0A8T0S3C3_PANVG|nr:hypothetical protein PVAP13_5NG589486 [Panicum virgatum]
MGARRGRFAAPPPRSDRWRVRGRSDRDATWRAGAGGWSARSYSWGREPRRELRRSHRVGFGRPRRPPAARRPPPAACPSPSVAAVTAASCRAALPPLHLHATARGVGFWGSGFWRQAGSSPRGTNPARIASHGNGTTRPRHSSVLFYRAAGDDGCQGGGCGLDS